MRKLFVTVLITAVIVVAGCACADDESSKMTFDDVTFGKAYKIKGYASITLLGFKFVDAYAQWWENENIHEKMAKDKNWWVDRARKLKISGNEADFAWLKADIRNLGKMDAKFLADITVKIIYDDDYEYDGWVRQFNYDYSKAEVRTDNKDIGVIGWPTCLSPKDEMSVGPMYTGHYAFGCTLPNFVVEDKESPLRMVITIGGHKLTYNIRK